MKKILIFTLLLIACKSNTETHISSDFEIGIIADCQYCNCDSQGNRFYRQSPDKFKSAIEKLIVDVTNDGVGSSKPKSE